MKPSAQIKMCVQTVAQFVFHEGNNVKCLFVFNWPNNLNNNNFGQLYVFWEVEVEDNKCEDFTPKPHKGIELVLFT
jgi:redox-sensitive bicupin YhaK (pirin superfamily)